MELEDCAFPLLAGIEAHSDPMTAFKDTDYALLVGARPRGPGMERADLLAANAQIFTAQGQGSERRGFPQCARAGGGQPANTNAYIAMKSALICQPRTSPPCCAWTTTALLRKSPPRSAALWATSKAGRVGQPLAHHVR